jgi:hypothetical protein
VGGYRKGMRRAIVYSWYFTHSQGFGETFILVVDTPIL